MISLKRLLTHNIDTLDNPHPGYTNTTRGQRTRQCKIYLSSPLQKGQVA